MPSRYLVEREEKVISPSRKSEIFDNACGRPVAALTAYQAVIHYRDYASLTL